MIRFNKIKYDDVKVTLFYDIIYNGIVQDKKRSTSIHEPNYEFCDAMNNLTIDVIEICELPEMYTTGMRIRGVSLSWANNIMGVVITAFKTLETANSPLVINTPHLPSEDYSGNNPNALILTGNCVERIENLIEQAELYLAGKRKQESLFEITVGTN